MVELTHAEAVQAVDFGRLAHQVNAASETIDAAPDLKSILSTAELSRRVSRPPDHAAENRALSTLMHELATSPHTVLRKLAEAALALCQAHSAGISLLNDDKTSFHWPAIVGTWVRIPTIVTTASDTSRPPVPIDRDQCEGAVRCIF